MQIAIDKETIKQVKDFSKNKYIYVFENETLEQLTETNLHCIHKDYIEETELEIDINLTDYKINCYKKANIEDKEWDKLPEIRDYKYAIIVPNYNNNHGEYKGKTFLQNCIESILNQTYKNFELIIVDDMSTDSSVKTVQSYKSKEEYVDKIHLLQNKRKRYNGGSRNVGIEYALDNLDIDYFCFIDSDDWWLNENVLENINRRIKGNEMMILGSEMLFPNNKRLKQFNKFDNYEDVFMCINKVWCTAWSRVIRVDKIVYFAESTLMEDRVWSYRQADNCDFDKIVNLNKIVYCWNRLNTENSVSLSGSNFWNASAWCHIGHQKQFLGELKHKQFKDIIEERIEKCINKVNSKIYEQY